MKSKIFNIPQVGNVLVAKHHRATRITLKIKPKQLPTVVIPLQMPYNTGFMFAVEKKQWIMKTLKKLQQKEYEKTMFDENNPFKTRYKIIYFKNEGIKFEIQKTNDAITLVFPLSKNIKSDENQQIIKNFIIETLRLEAKQHLPVRVELYAQKFGFSYKKVFIKNMKSRWGSCSSANNINLNLHLMRLPEYLSDFIILHELCHTVHRNHGEQFHKLLNKISGDEKFYNKEIKKYTTEL